MEDLNWKTWLLIILVVVGVSFEAIKRIQPKNEFLNLEKLGLTQPASPYNVKYKSVNSGQNQARLPMVKPMRVAGQDDISRSTLEKFINANKPQETNFEHKTADAKKAVKKKKKDDDEWEIIIDPVTGKKYRRKKKKGPPAEPKQDEVAKEEPKEESDDNEEDMDNVMAEAIATGQLPPVKSKANNPFADLEEWKRKLLTHPDLAETRRFIQAYIDGLVTADIFYKIAAMMLEDSRTKMKELGVLCAGMTKSVMSFTLLAEVVKKERSGDSIRTYAESFIDHYGDLGSLKHLQGILRAPASNFVATLAAKELNDSANSNLAASKHKPPKNPTAQNYNQHSNSSYYRPFVSILQGMSRSKDRQVADVAQATLSTINSLMTVNGTSTQPPTQPGGQHNLPAQASFP